MGILKLSFLHFLVREGLLFEGKLNYTLIEFYSFCYKFKFRLMIELGIFIQLSSHHEEFLYITKFLGKILSRSFPLPS